MAHMMLGTIALLLVVACGGGGGTASAPQGPPPSNAPAPNAPPPQPNGPTGSVVVTVVDIFGEPIPAARVGISAQDTGLNGSTDASGKARFSDVPDGDVGAYAYGSDDTRGSFFGEVTTNLAANDHVEMAITALPSSNPIIGSTIAIVDPVEVSDDGRSLTLRLTLRQVQDHNGWVGIGLSLAPCTPDPSNDVVTFHADCVEGTGGFDASYDVVEPPPSTWITFDVTGTSEPYAAMLLMDQSRRIVANDPWDLRLFAAKYLVTNLADDPLLLAAFAADDFVGGEPARLDNLPVTVVATDIDASTYDAIDNLAMLEGGESPLYAALDRSIELIAASSSSPGQRRVVVVLTDGHDDTCGTMQQCRDVRQAIVDRSIANEIDIVMLVLPGGTEEDRRAVAELVATSGRAYWPDDPVQLPVLLGMLPEVLRGRGESREVTFHLEADAEDTFVSGRTVYGMVKPEICPWDCYITSFPISFRIP